MDGGVSGLNQIAGMVISYRQDLPILKPMLIVKLVGTELFVGSERCRYGKLPGVNNLSIW
jgi:hypothetical protein